MCGCSRTRTCVLGVLRIGVPAETRETHGHARTRAHTHALHTHARHYATKQQPTRFDACASCGSPSFASAPGPAPVSSASSLSSPDAACRPRLFLVAVCQQVWPHGMSHSLLGATRARAPPCRGHRLPCPRASRASIARETHQRVARTQTRLVYKHAPFSSVSVCLPRLCTGRSQTNRTVGPNWVPLTSSLATTLTRRDLAEGA